MPGNRIIQPQQIRPEKKRYYVESVSIVNGDIITTSSSGRTENVGKATSDPRVYTYSDIDGGFASTDLDAGDATTTNGFTLDGGGA